MLLAGSACGSKTANTVETSSGNPSDHYRKASDGITSIPQLKQQVAQDSIALLELQERYQNTMLSDFRWCDSMLAFVNEQKVQDYFDALNLAQAYVTQFNTTLPVMSRDIAYLQVQLTNLQNDIDTHYINDSLASAYFEDEKAVADTLHYRIQYFEEKLSQQSLALQSLKENLSKETIP